MPEFEGTSDTLSFQGALEDAVRKAYTAYQRRTHTDPLFGYVVKRISGHLRTLTVVIETVLDESERQAQGPGPSQSASVEPASAAAPNPIQELLDKQRRNEALTPNEQALLDLLRQDTGGNR
jgi:hypothetical protein